MLLYKVEYSLMGEEMGEVEGVVGEVQEDLLLGVVEDMLHAMGGGDRGKGARVRGDGGQAARGGGDGGQAARGGGNRRQAAIGGGDRGQSIIGEVVEDRVQLVDLNEVDGNMLDVVEDRLHVVSEVV